MGMPHIVSRSSCSAAAGCSGTPNTSVRRNPSSFAAAPPTQSASVMGEPSGFATPSGIGSGFHPVALFSSRSIGTAASTSACQSGCATSGCRVTANCNAPCASEPSTSGESHSYRRGRARPASQRPGHERHESNDENEAWRGRATSARTVPSVSSNSRMVSFTTGCLASRRTPRPCRPGRRRTSTTWRPRPATVRSSSVRPCRTTGPAASGLKRPRTR